MILLKGNILHTPALGQLETFPHGGLLLEEDGTIRTVLSHIPEGLEARVIDYGDRLLLQSFCDMHLHAPQYPMLGMGTDLPLLQWLHRYAYPTEARFADADYAQRVYRQLAQALIASGTTRVCMFSSLHTDATLILMEELEKAGVTGFVGKVNMDRNGEPALQETTESSKRETLRWLEACTGFRYVRPILTPRFTPSCTDELMAFLGELAQKRGLYVQSHLSENKSEVEWVRTLHPDCSQYWQTYAKFGLWKEHTLMAHCVQCREEEIRSMAENGVIAVHCPDSNVNICSGTAPIRHLLERGVWVTLGSDIAGGAQLPMNQVITAGIRASKVLHMTDPAAPSFLTAAEGYYLGTASGHRYFGAGPGFAPWDKLHALVVDDSAFPEPASPLSLPERLERALYLMTPDSITARWSEGRLLP